MITVVAYLKNNVAILHVVAYNKYNTNKQPYTSMQSFFGVQYIFMYTKTPSWPENFMNHGMGIGKTSVACLPKSHLKQVKVYKETGYTRIPKKKQTHLNVLSFVFFF